jgi:hypothetical protein
MFIRALLGSLLSLVALVGPVSAATSSVSTLVAQAGSSTITGQVVGDSGKGIGGASVLIQGAGTRTTVTTGNDGTFSAPVPPGVYTITVNKGGYQAGTTEVTVAPSGATIVNVALTANSLNTLNIIGRTATNAASNVARFNVTSTTTNVITSAQIRARNTPDLTSIIQELPGITIPRATSNPNQGFVLRGLRQETVTELDGHPVSSGTSGTFLTNYAASGIFGGVDVLKGGGIDGPISGESGIGIVNLRTPDFTTKDSGYLQGGLDNYGGSFYTALADINITPKLSLIAGKTFTGYRGPTYGLTEPDGYLAVTPPSPYGTFGPPSNLANVVVPYIQDFSDTYSLNGELAKLRYKFSDATSFSVEFLGLEGRYDPQGGAYGQFEGYATVSPCLNGKVAGTAATCNDLSTYSNPGATGLIGKPGTPLYAFYPGSDVRQNNPNWNAEFKTTIGNDTLLFRPYTAAINRLIDGTQEVLVPGDNGNWYQVTNSANCQAQYVGPSAANGGAKGPCFAAATAPGAAYINPLSPQFPVVFATTSTPLNCSVAAPCYTTPTAINNSGQYGYGSPYTTLELDHLFGYTFSYIHPFGANTLNVSLDHYFDDATAYVNDASPLAAGCTFVYGSSQANQIPGKPTGTYFQPNCKDSDGNVLATLRPTPVSVPETFSSRTSVGVSAHFAVAPQVGLDVGGYFTKYLINAQQQNPATLVPAYIAANYAGVAAAVPIQPVGIQNAGSHIDPRFGLTWRAARDLSVRFSAGSSQTLPYPSLVSGFLSYSLGSTSSTISTPNYGLLPEEIVQEDLGADYRYSKHGGVFSWDLYNAVVHNPWISTKIPFCGGPASLGLRPCVTGTDFPEATGEGFTSQTLNGAQQYAQGVEFTFTDEPQFGFGYRFNSSFERNYYLQTPAVYFGNSAQVFYNGAQFASTGSGNTSVPYAKAYAEVQYATRGYQVRFGADYEGNNNEYNVPAFFIFDTGVRINTGFHEVYASVSGENILNNTFGSLLGRGVEYQGLSPVAGTPAVGGYTYSTPFNTAAVSPGPPTWRFSLVKQF